jgi:hypothetical protein
VPRVYPDPRSAQIQDLVFLPEALAVPVGGEGGVGAGADPFVAAAGFDGDGSVLATAAAGLAGASSVFAAEGFAGTCSVVATLASGVAAGFAGASIALAAVGFC